MNIRIEYMYPWRNMKSTTEDRIKRNANLPMLCFKMESRPLERGEVQVWEIGGRIRGRSSGFGERRNQLSRGCKNRRDIVLQSSG